MTRTIAIAMAIAIVTLLAAVGCAVAGNTTAEVASSNVERADRIDLTEAEWRAKLTPEQFHILREQGTERAFTGKYAKHKEKGTYKCAGCGLELFASSTKFESGTGWPSYTQPIAPDAIESDVDNKFGMTRTEVHCARCGGHLGHVFPDGPAPTGLRYCINSASLDFDAAPETQIPADQ